MRANDAVLFVWATAPKLPEALRAVEVGYFTHQTNFVREKLSLGVGSWNRGRHDLLLVATRGNSRPCCERRGILVSTSLGQPPRDMK